MLTTNTEFLMMFQNNPEKRPVAASSAPCTMAPSTSLSAGTSNTLDVKWSNLAALNAKPASSHDDPSTHLLIPAEYYQRIVSACTNYIVGEQSELKQFLARPSSGFNERQYPAHLQFEKALRDEGQSSAIVPVLEIALAEEIFGVETIAEDFKAFIDIFDSFDIDDKRHDSPLKIIASLFRNNYINLGFFLYQHVFSTTIEDSYRYKECGYNDIFILAHCCMMEADANVEVSSRDYWLLEATRHLKQGILSKDCFEMNLIPFYLCSAFLEVKNIRSQLVTFVPREQRKNFNTANYIVTDITRDNKQPVLTLAFIQQLIQENTNKPTYSVSIAHLAYMVRLAKELIDDTNNVIPVQISLRIFFKHQIARSLRCRDHDSVNRSKILEEFSKNAYLKLYKHLGFRADYFNDITDLIENVVDKELLPMLMNLGEYKAYHELGIKLFLLTVVEDAPQAVICRLIFKHIPISIDDQVREDVQAELRRFERMQVEHKRKMVSYRDLIAARIHQLSKEVIASVCGEKHFNAYQKHLEMTRKCNEAATANAKEKPAITPATPAQSVPAPLAPPMHGAQPIPAAPPILAAAARAIDPTQPAILTALAAVSEEYNWLVLAAFNESVEALIGTAPVLDHLLRKSIKLIEKEIHQKLLAVLDNADIKQRNYCEFVIKRYNEFCNHYQSYFFPSAKQIITNHVITRRNKLIYFLTEMILSNDFVIGRKQYDELERIAQKYNFSRSFIPTHERYHRGIDLALTEHVARVCARGSYDYFRYPYFLIYSLSFTFLNEKLVNNLLKQKLRGQFLAALAQVNWQLPYSIQAQVFTNIENIMRNFDTATIVNTLLTDDLLYPFLFDSFHADAKTEVHPLSREIARNLSLSYLTNRELVLSLVNFIMGYYKQQLANEEQRLEKISIPAASRNPIMLLIAKRKNITADDFIISVRNHHYYYHLREKITYEFCLQLLKLDTQISSSIKADYFAIFAKDHFNADRRELYPVLAWQYLNPDTQQVKNRDFTVTLRDHQMTARLLLLHKINLTCKRQLDEHDYSQTTFQDVVFDQCRLHQPSFEGAMLMRVQFTRCHLTQANFSSSLVSDVKFEHCELNNPDFSHATLENISLIGTSFSRAHFPTMTSVLRLFGCNLKQIISAEEPKNVKIEWLDKLVRGLITAMIPDDPANAITKDKIFFELFHQFILQLDFHFFDTLAEIKIFYESLDVADLYEPHYQRLDQLLKAKPWTTAVFSGNLEIFRRFYGDEHTQQCLPPMTVLVRSLVAPLQPHNLLKENQFTEDARGLLHETLATIIAYNHLFAPRGRTVLTMITQTIVDLQKAYRADDCGLLQGSSSFTGNTSAAVKSKFSLVPFNIIYRLINLALSRIAASFGGVHIDYQQAIDVIIGVIARNLETHQLSNKESFLIQSALQTINSLSDYVTAAQQKQFLVVPVATQFVLFLESLRTLPAVSKASIINFYQLSGFGDSESRPLFDSIVFQSFYGHTQSANACRRLQSLQVVPGVLDLFYYVSRFPLESLCVDYTNIYHVILDNYQRTKREAGNTPVSKVLRQSELRQLATSPTDVTCCELVAYGSTQYTKTLLKSQTCDLANLELHHMHIGVVRGDGLPGVMIDCSGSFLNNVIMTGILRQPIFSSAHLVSTVFTKADLLDSKWQNSSLRENVQFYNCKLIQAVFCYSHCHEVTFTHCQMTAAEFSEATLDTVTFDYITLKESNFINAQLYRTDFKGCEMDQVNFSQANLQHVTMRQCTLQATLFPTIVSLHNVCDATIALIHNAPEHANNRKNGEQLKREEMIAFIKQLSKAHFAEPVIPAVPSLSAVLALEAKPSRAIAPLIMHLDSCRQRPSYRAIAHDDIAVPMPFFSLELKKSALNKLLCELGTELLVELRGRVNFTLEQLTAPEQQALIIVERIIPDDVKKLRAQILKPLPSPSSGHSI
jgi:uncharacterized protein YjbI with pentapeptide repeats